jgi:tRNA(Glu) U13 pseudouridine synthase TruD
MIRDDVAVGVAGQKIGIRDGKIEGNKFSFTVKAMKKNKQLHRHIFGR